MMTITCADCGEQWDGDDVQSRESFDWSAEHTARTGHAVFVESAARKLEL